MSPTAADPAATVTSGPAGPDRPDFGVYVHVPFCSTRCHYCDFVTYTGMEQLRGPYARALLTEAELAVAALRGAADASPPERSAQPEAPPVVSSVFVGGGTPTLLPPEDLGALLTRLRGLLPFDDGAEITVEANPETVTPELAAGLAAAGVNRVSMGAQSFDDQVLAALGRPHTHDRIAAAVHTLRAAGLTDLNLDLIYGCPHEDAATWADTMAAALALEPAHISAYALTIEHATKFGRMVAAGTMAEPDPDLLADRYDDACDTLAAAGYHHYEVSNWARGPLGDTGLPAHASRHNLTYWRRGSYLGLGAGAHESTDGARRWNGPDVPGYLRAVAAGRRPTAGQEHLQGTRAAFEELVLRLRTVDGLTPAAARRLGVDPDSGEVAALRAAGLVRDGDRLALTDRGLYLHAEIVARLAPDEPAARAAV